MQGAKSKQSPTAGAGVYIELREAYSSSGFRGLLGHLGRPLKEKKNQSRSHDRYESTKVLVQGG